MIVNNYRHFEINVLNDNAKSVLLNALSRLKSIKYWMSAGTALGLYRNNDFIEGDTDIDIAMVGYSGIDNEIIKAMVDDTGFELIRDIYHEDMPQQLAFMKDGVIFDIYIHWREGDNYINNSESGKQTMPKWMYDSQKIINTKYGNLPFPKDPEKYFEIRYGDWKIPQNKKAVYEKI